MPRVAFWPRFPQCLRLDTQYRQALHACGGDNRHSLLTNSASKHDMHGVVTTVTLLLPSSTSKHNMHGVVTVVTLLLTSSTSKHYMHGLVTTVTPC